MDVIKLNSFKTLARQMKFFKDKKEREEEETKNEDKTKKTEGNADQEKNSIIIQKKFIDVQNISSNTNVLTQLFKGENHMLSTTKTIKKDSKNIFNNRSNNVSIRDKRSSKSNNQLSFIFNEKSENNKENNKEDDDDDDFNYCMTRRYSKSFHKKSNIKKKNLIHRPTIETEIYLENSIVEKNDKEKGEKINNVDDEKNIKKKKMPYYEKAEKLENLRKKDLEIKRMQKLSEEKKKFHDIPIINENSRYLIKNYIPPQERTNAPHCEHFLKIDINKSEDYNIEKNLILDSDNKKSFNQKNWDNFIEFQNEWQKRVNSKIQNEQQKTVKSNTTYFIPKINKSKSMKNVENDNEDNVYDRLYDDFEKYNNNKIILNNLLSPSFKPIINKKKKINKNKFQRKYGDILDYVLKKYDLKKSNNILDSKIEFSKNNSNNMLLSCEKSPYIENLLNKFNRMNDGLKIKIDKKINEQNNKIKNKKSSSQDFNIKNKELVENIKKLNSKDNEKLSNNKNKNSFSQDFHIKNKELLDRPEKLKPRNKKLSTNKDKNSLSIDFYIKNKELLDKLEKLKSEDNEKSSSSERNYRLNIGENTPSFIKPNVMVASKGYLDFFINKNK